MKQVKHLFLQEEKRMLKKILCIVFMVALIILDLYFLYLSIGYLVLGTKAPLLFNGEYAHFMGMYLMSVTYFVPFLILTTILIIILIKFIKKKKSLHK